MSDVPDVSNPDERIEWIISRAQKLDFIRSESWIADEIEKLWNNPHEFEGSGLYDPPEGVDEDAYALFMMGVTFGTDYEYYFPRGNREDWIFEPEDDQR